MTPDGVIFVTHDPGPALMRRDSDGAWRHVYPSPAPGPTAGWVTPTFGYGIGRSDRARLPLMLLNDGGPGEVRVTQDGGVSWHATLSLGREARDVAFDGAGTGLAVDAGTSAWFTHDGGMNWEPIAGLNVASVSVDPAGGMWAVTVDGRLMYSDDDWSSPAAVAGDVGTGRLDFVSLGEAWVLSQTGVLSYSPDGGTTWSPRVIGVKSYDFASGRVGWVLSDEGRVFRTLDGASTWTEVRFRGIRVEAVAAADAEHAWVYGPRGCWLATSDGGRTWDWPGPPGWAPCDA